MFTRFFDDEARREKQAQITSYQGRYFIDTPGPGLDMSFQEDPQLRIQRWGANMKTNTVNLESDLRGMTRKLNRDYQEENNYNNHAAFSDKLEFRTTAPYVEESRASHPAWMYRSVEPNRWEMPWINPQANLEKEFSDNIQTRIIEKDGYRPSIPTLPVL
jgi:hypothetical protein